MNDTANRHEENDATPGGTQGKTMRPTTATIAWTRLAELIHPAVQLALNMHDAADDPDHWWIRTDDDKPTADDVLANLIAFDAMDGRNQPKDTDPAAHWEEWNEEGLEQMIADIGQKTGNLVALITWHQYSQREHLEAPEDSRRRILDAIDDLRGLMNRDAER